MVRAQLPNLVEFCKTSFELVYIDYGRRKTRVVFILKTGNKSPDEAKSYGPICLAPFLLKAFEKYESVIRAKYISYTSLRQYQHPYQCGKFTESALQNLV